MDAAWFWHQDLTSSKCLMSPEQALAGSRESRDPGICSQPKSRDFQNWNPGIFRDFLLLCFGPLGTLFSPAPIFFFFTFSALPSPYSLMERGQHTKTNINTLSSQASSLRRHLKTHSGEKSNKCNQCDYASSRAGDLRAHLKTHSGEKPNKCNKCDYASSQASNLKRHLMKHHGQNS